MNDQLINRLASLPNFSKIPQEELQWLVEHGQFEVRDVGFVVGPKGKTVKYLWIVLSGNISIRVDHGVGSRLVTEWKAGDVTGMLPYSRMKSPPGDNYIKEKADLISISVDLFSQMINKCPLFTAYTVHCMVDRARNFNSTALQEEKMISLGKLASGLAHEINNPASATIRDAKLIKDNLDNLDKISQALGSAGLSKKQLQLIENLRVSCLIPSKGTTLSPIQKADFQDEISKWILQKSLDTELALPLADTAITLNQLDELAASIPNDKIEIVIKWIIANCYLHSLAIDIEQSANHTFNLVDSFKKFTYMDNLADKETLDVEPSIRDTINVLVAKVNSVAAHIKLEADEDLPQVYAKGSELNQVWLSLIDNALDAIDHSGNIHIKICAELNRVEVRIIDDGPGIPEHKISSIFDAFFTTKPQGQGIGLGLDIARRILHRYNGEISVQSRPGRTEFLVSLETVA